MDIKRQVADALLRHRFDGELFECWCQRDLPDAEVTCMDREEHAEHVADTLLSELGAELVRGALRRLT